MDNQPSPPTIKTAGFSRLEDDVEAEVDPFKSAVDSDIIVVVKV